MLRGILCGVSGDVLAARQRASVPVADKDSVEQQDFEDMVQRYTALQAAFVDQVESWGMRNTAGHCRS